MATADVLGGVMVANPNLSEGGVDFKFHAQFAAAPYVSDLIVSVGDGHTVCFPVGSAPAFTGTTPIWAGACGSGTVVGSQVFTEYNIVNGGSVGDVVLQFTYVYPADGLYVAFWRVDPAINTPPLPVVAYQP
jgi:hypothetical protein